MSIFLPTVHLVFNIISWTVIITIFVQWFVRDPYHPLRSFLDSIVEPMLAPIRQIMPQTGMLDFSPLVLLIVLQLIEAVLVAVLRSLG